MARRNGALGTDPGRANSSAQTTSRRAGSGGALATNPTTGQGYVMVGDKKIDTSGFSPDRVKRLQNLVSHGPKYYEKALGEVKQWQAAPSQTPAQDPAGQTPQGPTYDSVTGQGNAAMSDIFNQMQSQGAFNPGDYGAQMDAARNSVMDQFNQENEPAFKNQEAAWRQRMAEQGVDPNSEGAKEQYRQMMQSQNNARQTAMNQANLAAQNVQQQGYTQQLSTYNNPYSNLGAFSPMINAQAGMQMQGAQDAAAMARQTQNQNWQTNEQMPLAQRYLLEQEQKRRFAPSGGGSGALTYDQQLGLQNNQFYNNMVLYGMQNQGVPQGSVANSAIAGGAAGAGAAITGSLLR